MIFTRIPDRWRNAAIVAASFVALVIVCGLIALAFDRYVLGKQDEAVSRDRTEVSRDAAERALSADRAATANQTVTDDAFQNSQEALRDEVRTKGTDAPVGPATAAVLDRLRREQAGAARRDAAR